MRREYKLLALTLSVFIVCCLAVTAPQSWAQSQPAAPPQEKNAEQVYRNVQVFKGLPASQLYPAMNFISGALGVTCAHCHVPNQFEKDDKAAKQTARRMIEMTMALNRTSFGEAQAVSCYTCHRGQVQPVSIPVVAMAATHQTAASNALPTVDQLLDRYVSALGGREKLEKITTLMMKGTESPSGMANNPASRTLEVYRKAPNKLLLANAQDGNNSQRVFDGETGWQQFGGRTMGMSATDLGIIRREAQFDRNYNLRAQYSRMIVTGRAKIGERETWVVEATPVETRIGPMGLDREWLYFEANTGLLARRQIEAKTVLGKMPFAIDFDDYREIDGVKWPFIVRQLFANLAVTQRFAEIKLNTPLEDERFKQPATKQ
jgi:hypothetical protein